VTLFRSAWFPPLGKFGRIASRRPSNCIVYRNTLCSARRRTMLYSNFIFFPLAVAFCVSLGTNRTWRTSHVFGPSLLDWCNERNARTLLHRTSAAHHLWKVKKKSTATVIEQVLFHQVQFHIHVLEYSTQSTVQNPALDLGLFWFHGVFFPF
jgi:hypothetical protein